MEHKLIETISTLTSILNDIHNKDHPPHQEPPDEAQEPPQTESPNLLNLIESSDLSTATKKNYQGCVGIMQSWFVESNLVDIIKHDIYRILFNISEKYVNENTKRKYYSTVTYISKQFQLQDQIDILSSLISDSAQKSTNSAVTKLKQTLMPLEEAETMIQTNYN